MGDGPDHRNALAPQSAVLSRISWRGDKKSRWIGKAAKDIKDLLAGSFVDVRDATNRCFCSPASRLTLVGSPSRACWLIDT